MKLNLTNNNIEITGMNTKIVIAILSVKLFTNSMMQAQNK